MATIHVVEDNAQLRFSLERVLERAGHEVIAANDVPAAVASLERAEPDVLIADLQLPGGSGLDVARRARERTPDVDVIFITGDANLDVALAGLRQGASDLLPKPFDDAALLAAVDRCLADRRMRHSAELLESTRAIFASEDPSQVLVATITAATRTCRASEGSILLPRDHAHLYVAETTSARVPRGSTVAIGGNVIGAVLAAREPTRIHRLADDPRFAGLAQRARVQSSIVYPLYQGERLAGVLTLNRTDDPRPFRASDLDRVAPIASQMLLALDNARLRSANAMSERLAGVGQLSAAIVHEINNPLAAALMGLDMARQESKSLGATAGELPELLDEMGAALQRIREIVADVQTLTRGEGVRRPMDVDAAVGAALRLSRHELNRTAVTVTTNLGGPLTLTGSPGRLSQVFINLIVNAAQAGAKAITVTTRRVGDAAIVEIADNGGGIPEEHLSRVFEPLFSTKGEGGTGLGLWICREIVRDHGGEITIESRVGAGTTVRVALGPVL